MKKYQESEEFSRSYANDDLDEETTIPDNNSLNRDNAIIDVDFEWWFKQANPFNF